MRYPRQSGQIANTVFLSKAANWLVVLPLLYFADIGGAASQDQAAGGMMLGAVSSSGATLSRLGKVGIWICLSFILLKAARGIRAILGENLLLIAFPVLALASTIWSQDPPKSALYSVFLFFSIAFAAWLADRFDDFEIMELLTITGMIAGIASIAVVILWPARGLDHVHDNAWQGLFYSKNHCGRMMLFLALPAFHLPNTTRYAYRWIYLGIAVLLIAESRSETTLILLALYLLFLISIRFFRRFPRRLLAGLCVLAVLLLCAFVPYAASSLRDIFRPFSGGLTLSGRTVIWGVLLQSVVKQPLLGYGYNAFWTLTGEGWNAFVGVWGALGFMATYSHSGYLDVVLQLGFVGLALLFVLIGRAMKDAWASFLRRRDSRTSWYIGILLLSFIYNIDEVTFLMANQIPWILFVLACVNLHRKRTSDAAVIPPLVSLDVR